MKNLIKEQIEYLQDNPERHWFKRKLYGYGWTPATREGWIVTTLVLLIILGNAIRFETAGYPESAVLKQVLLPTFLAVGILLYICYQKGEKPKWQWGNREGTEVGEIE